MASPARSAEADISLAQIIASTRSVRNAASEKIEAIQSITSRMRILALNALIEAARAGDQGRGFGVVAGEVREISASITEIAEQLQGELGSKIGALEEDTRRMAEASIGGRLVDLALNAIEIIDRNLYERTCDVRWWATDSAIVDAAASADPAVHAHAASRLGVILDAYTVYHDIFVCGLDGRIVTNGRPDLHPVTGADCSDRAWFRKAVSLPPGDGYAADEVSIEPLLGGRQTATYAVPIRADGQAEGRMLGVLAVQFDWQPQAETIVKGVRIEAEDRACTRIMLVDAGHRVIAASDGAHGLSERFPLRSNGAASGFYVDEAGATVAFHATPGYETYRGLGWYGVIRQEKS